MLDRSGAVIHLVNDIISLKQADMVTIVPELVDIALVVAACVQGSHAAERAGISVNQHTEPDLPLVLARCSALGTGS